MPMEPQIASAMPPSLISTKPLRWWVSPNGLTPEAVGPKALEPKSTAVVSVDPSCCLGNSEEYFAIEFLRLTQSGPETLDWTGWSKP